MALISPKSNAVLFMLISALLLSVVITDGGHRKLLEKLSQGKGVLQDMAIEEASFVRSRMLSVKTNDYASYDPSPSFEKPPYKLIPN